MRIMTTSGPSILGVEVSTRKQRAAQHKVSMTHCVWLSGFLMAYENDTRRNGGKAGLGLRLFLRVE